MADTIFHRPDLANELADAILNNAALAPARSGLFLAAPRRTGKSTFLREDLMPALENRGAAVLYVDLWADKSMEPGQAIVSLVRSAFAQDDGFVLKMARKAGMEKVNVGGLSFDVAKVGLGTGVTLSQALAALSDRVKAPIVLMIDEAQHAATTEGGNNALFALKAARDELNSSAHFGLRIVATGSSRPKLAILRASKDQAFFRAQMKNFPPLDEGYVHWFIDNAGLLQPLDPAGTVAAFERASWRPEVLVQALGDVFDDDAVLASPERLDDAFSAAVDAAIEESDEAMLKVVRALTPLQGAVLRVLATQGEDYSPYAAASMAAYAEHLARLDPDSAVKADTPNVQSALEALQSKSLVWRAAHGEYALEEQGLVELMRAKGLLD